MPAGPSCLLVADKRGRRFCGEPHHPGGEQYAAEWTATKLCWDLTADAQEQAEPPDLAEQCPTPEVHFEIAP
ncbi:hypothetical protein GCM10009730_68020 [Streptomyces albidochromogenes]